MRERRTAVVLQRTKQWIRVDLIARSSQITAAVIAAEIVSKRRDGAEIVKDVCTQCTGIQDYVGDLNDTYTKLSVDINAPARRCRVAGDRAICNAQPRVEVEDSDAAPLVPAELPLMVLFTMLESGSRPLTEIPPPLVPAELPLIVLLATVSKVP